jgi:hypothetical protein
MTPTYSYQKFHPQAYNGDRSADEMAAFIKAKRS